MTHPLCMICTAPADEKSRSLCDTCHQEWSAAGVSLQAYLAKKARPDVLQLLEKDVRLQQAVTATAAVLQRARQEQAQVHLLFLSQRMKLLGEARPTRRMFAAQELVRLNEGERIFIDWLSEKGKKL